MSGPAAGSFAIHNEGQGLFSVSMHGEYDLSDVAVLRASLFRRIDRGERGIVDLTDVSFLDSAVLHCFYEADRRSRERDGRLVLVLPPEHQLERRFAILQFHEVCPMVPTLDEAIRWQALSSNPAPSSSGRASLPMRP